MKGGIQAGVRIFAPDIWLPLLLEIFQTLSVSQGVVLWDTREHHSPAHQGTSLGTASSSSLPTMPTIIKTTRIP